MNATLTRGERIAFTLSLLLLAVAICLLVTGCSQQRQLIVLRSYVSTNFVPGYIGGPRPKVEVGPDGYVKPTFVNAVAIAYPPNTNLVTNYVIGYRSRNGTVEVQRIP